MAVGICVTCDIGTHKHALGHTYALCLHVSSRGRGSQVQLAGHTLPHWGAAVPTTCWLLISTNYTSSACMAGGGRRALVVNRTLWPRHCATRVFVTLSCHLLTTINHSMIGTRQQTYRQDRSIKPCSKTLNLFWKWRIHVRKWRWRQQRSNCTLLHATIYTV